ncbi:tetratricopeptide repeat protein [Plebeiibacterium sediminum]|uniref:Tetratricopeptide repeat protein n=1 Tax=Plebeiibacterium sediminum TaxID=2992112 RepID=A0AAE3SF84_9BACT|nr:hypothetical protein [Plebeiobacterium sediminum]MCW3787006.1 hypothetical protein [Plebeiobacterium sediminum]
MKKVVLVTALVFLCKVVVLAQDVNAKIDVCKKYLMDQKYTEVIEECQVLFESDLDSVNSGLVYAFAGLANKELGNSDQAVAYLKKSIEYRVKRYDIYETFIGLTNEKNDGENYEFGLLQEAFAFPDLAYLVNPKLVNYYIKSKQYEKLIGFSDKMLESNPNDVDYLYYSAYGYQHLKQSDKAEEYFLKVLNNNPDHKNANLSLGNLYFKKASQEYNLQKKKYEKLKSPTRVDYDHYRKSLEHSKSIYEKALPYLLKVYNNEPNDNLKGVLYNVYSRLDKKELASQYKQ